MTEAVRTFKRVEFHSAVGFYAVEGDEITMVEGGEVMKRKLNGDDPERVAMNELMVRQFDRG